MKTKIKTYRLLNIAILVILFFLVQNKVTAQDTYYVSCSDGNDSYDGISATYDGTHGPWKTLSKVGSTTFTPGDSILLKRGDIWRESLILSTSGNSSSKVYYGDYGSGDKPVINCADTITGWTVYSGNIWSAILDTSIVSVPQLFMDGERMVISRWPNSGWSTIDSTSTTGYYLYDTALTQADNYWVGATMQIRDCDWAIEAREIAASSSSLNRISWNTALGWSLKAKTGYGYYMENKLALVDTVGEWYFDVNTHTLYLQMATGENPNNHTIEASVRTEGIKGYYKYYITLENLDIKNSAYRGIECRGGHLNIVNNEISGSFYTGIFCAYGTFNTIDSNTIIDTESGYGIYGVSITSSSVTDNTVNNIGFDSVSIKGGKGMALTNFEGDVSGNYISNASSVGITVWAGTLHIYNNEIYRCMLHLNDGGGIYMNEDQSGSVIEQNYIHDLPGGNAGTPNNTISTVGLYLDESGCCATFCYNIVSDCTNGIHLHKSYNTNVFNNTFYNNTNGISIQEGSANQMYGDTIKNNISYSSSSSQYGVRIIRNSSSTNSIGFFDNNLYFNESATNVIKYYNGTLTYYTLSAWQNRTGIDGANDPNSIQSDPLFVDDSNNDFHLTSSSPCIDAAEDLGLDEDFDGVSVPHGDDPDIGALEYIGTSKSATLSTKIDDDVLISAYPNPFKDEIKVIYKTYNLENVELSIHDINGRKVRVLENSKLSPGVYTYEWNAKDYPVGLYFVRIQTPNTQKTMKISLIE